jgi:hypothetical protein
LMKPPFRSPSGVDWYGTKPSLLAACGLSDH